MAVHSPEERLDRLENLITELATATRRGFDDVAGLFRETDARLDKLTRETDARLAKLAREEVERARFFD